MTPEYQEGAEAFRKGKKWEENPYPYVGFDIHNYLKEGIRAGELTKRSEWFEGYLTERYRGMLHCKTVSEEEKEG